MEHLLRYPAICVLLQRITHFPEDVWNTKEQKLRENVQLLVEGLHWEGKEKQ